MQLFLRGTVLPFQKEKTNKRPIEEYYPQEPLRVPLTGADEDVPTLVEADDNVLRVGQPLCRIKNVPVLSPIKGTLAGTVVLNHPLRGEILCAEIQPAKSRKMPSDLEVTPVKDLTPEMIIDAAEQAAIYDELDGVLLASKLRRLQLAADDPAADRCVLVVDATENDIFGTAAWAVLKEEPKLALFGLKTAARALRVNKSHIAVMLPGKQRRALRRAIGRENIYIVGDEYPVTVFTDGKDEVFRIGIQACIALAKAIKEGHKHTAAVVTVAGDGVKAPRNLRVPFGTDLGEILTHCKVSADAHIVLGDAMTGIACTDTHIPLVPGITTLLALKPHPVRVPGPCIGCGRCAAACHAELLPYEIVRRLENMHYERLRHLAATECDGCAACSYVCPAGRDVAAEVLRAQESNGTIFLNWGDDDNE